MKRILCIVMIVAVVGGVGVLFVPSVRERRLRRKAALVAYRDFDRLMASQKLEDAYQMCAPALRKQWEYEDFTNIWSSYWEPTHRAELGLDRKRPRTTPMFVEPYSGSNWVAITHGQISILLMVHTNGTWAVQGLPTLKGEIP